ncbi:MAG: hypothetical protein AAB393_09650, partial [Bacteroidota bacterium]
MSLNVLFVGAQGTPQPNASVNEQACRIASGIPRVAPDLETRLFLVTEQQCESFDGTAWDVLLDWADVAVVVKHVLLKTFELHCDKFVERCRANGVLIVSSPVDATFDRIDDRFVNELADAVVVLSEYQQCAIASVRGVESVHYVPHAVRTAFERVVPV